MATIIKPSEPRLLADWKMLCATIGERLAGTDAERQAADYIRDGFIAAGCADSRIEEFDCRSRRRADCIVSFQDGKRWTRVESQAITGAPSTPDGRAVEGDIVWLEMPEQAPRLKKNSLTGRIALLFGPLLDQLTHHRSLLAANPLAVIHVDHRLPFAWAKSDGAIPLWEEKYGLPPTATVSFADAWRWRQTGVRRARISINAKTVAARSTNVIADLPGTTNDVILVGAHHDTQANSVGADDNASGVVGLLELARLLMPLRRRRTIRFVSFGAEEQLSVGSAAYVRAHRDELESIALMVNLDSYASPLGHTVLVCAGGDDLAEFGRKQLERGGVLAALRRTVIPYADHFPFSAHGSPAVWLYRENFPGARWQHHSRHDNLENISASVAAELLAAVGSLIQTAASAPTLPFRRTALSDRNPDVERYARTLFGFDV